MKTEKGIKLPPIWLCIILDLLGCVSYFVPTWGEWIDLIWAPISAFFFFWLFGGKTVHWVLRLILLKSLFLLQTFFQCSPSAILFAKEKSKNSSQTPQNSKSSSAISYCLKYHTLFGFW